MSIQLVALFLLPTSVSCVRSSAHYAPSLRQLGDVHATEVIDFADPNANTRSKLHAMKSAAFKEMWPLSCTGENEFGKIVFGKPEDVDGFRCLKTAAGAIQPPIAPAWGQTSGYSICCKSACEEAAYSDCASISLSDAALSITMNVKELSLGSDISEMRRAEMRRAGGDDAGEGDDANDGGAEFDAVQVHHVDVTAEEKEEGVVQSLSLNIPDASAYFIEKTDELIPDGQAVLDLIASKLASLLTLLNTGHGGVKFLPCVHGSTTACRKKEDAPKGHRCHPIGKQLHKLPKQRADKFASSFHEDVEALEIGQTFGHFKYENGTNFAGGRYAVMIIKAYNKDKETPPICKLEDVYRAAVDDGAEEDADEDEGTSVNPEEDEDDGASVDDMTEKHQIEEIDDDNVGKDLPSQFARKSTRKSMRKSTRSSGRRENSTRRSSGRKSTRSSGRKSTRSSARRSGRRFGKPGGAGDGGWVNGIWVDEMPAEEYLVPLPGQVEAISADASFSRTSEGEKSSRRTSRRFRYR